VQNDIKWLLNLQKFQSESLRDWSIQFYLKQMNVNLTTLVVVGYGDSSGKEIRYKVNALLSLNTQITYIVSIKANVRLEHIC